MRVSVVCPYYNEEAIIESTVMRIVKNLSALPYEWELIVVNDGSPDDRGAEIARELSSRDRRVISVGYGANKGCGFALMKGIEASKGDIIMTTESDCSWGDKKIIHLTKKLEHMAR